jgi:hypothetical protein
VPGRTCARRWSILLTNRPMQDPGRSVTGSDYWAR